LVTVDNYFPVGKTGKLVFDSEGADGSLWGVYMEKIWAKAMGTY